MRKYLLLLLCGFTLSCTTLGSSKAITLNASASAGDTLLAVQNNDTRDWQGVQLGINGFDYSYKVGTLKAGEKITVKLNDFATYQGDRYNPYLKKLQVLYITSESPKGAASFSP